MRFIFSIVAMVVCLGCQPHSSSSENSGSPQGKLTEPGPTPTPTPSSQTGEVPLPSPTPTPTATPEIKAIDEWRALSGRYATLERDGNPGCSDPTECRSYLRHNDCYGKTPCELLMRVTLFVTFNQKWSIPVFNDPTLFTREGSTLVYNFSGPIHEPGSGSFSVTMRLSVDRPADGVVIFKGKGETSYQKFDFVYKLQKMSEEGRSL